MSLFYEEMRAIADGLLLEFGRPITVTRYQETVDKVASSTVKALLASQTLNGAVLPASQGTLEAFDVRFMEGLLTETNVRFCILSAEGSTFTPEPNDYVEGLDGKTWNVLGCTPLNVDGTAVIYSVGLRLPS